MAYRVQEQKENCCELKDKGFGPTAIARKLKISRGTVYLFLAEAKAKKEGAIAHNAL